MAIAGEFLLAQSSEVKPADVGGVRSQQVGVWTLGQNQHQRQACGLRDQLVDQFAGGRVEPVQVLAGECHRASRAVLRDPIGLCGEGGALSLLGIGIERRVGDGRRQR